MAGALLVSVTTAEQLRRLIGRSLETPPRDDTKPEQGRIPVLVRCTSTTPAGAGVGAECYPGIIVDPDSAELVADQPELGTVWLTLISAGAAATPAVDAVYPCLLSGEFDPGSDPRPRVFAVGGTGTLQTVEVVTNVQCVDGELVVTYSDLTGRDLVLS